MLCNMNWFNQSTIKSWRKIASHIEYGTDNFVLIIMLSQESSLEMLFVNIYIVFLIYLG